MSKWVVKACCMGLVTTSVLGLAGCNRQANADVSANVAASGSAAVTASVADAPPPGPGAASGPTAPVVLQPGTVVQTVPTYAYVPVSSAVPVYMTATGPVEAQEVCHDEVINHSVPPKDPHQIAGTAIGAVAGGLIGHMFGHGRGNTVTTVAGAVGGGYAGKKIEESEQRNHVQSTVVHRCDVVAGAAPGPIVGYDVTYVYNGATLRARMDHNPGNRVRVVQSAMVVSAAR